MQSYTAYRATAIALVCAFAISAAGELEARSVYSYIYHESDGIRQMSDSRVSSELTGPLSTAALRLRIIGGGEREYITVYGIDAEVFSHNGTRYSRGNLEDAGYSRSAAERIRAIVSASYPNKTLEELIAYANAATEPHTFDALTESDAIAAAQAAIWSCASADGSKISPPFSYKDTRGAEGKFRYDAERERLINGLRDLLLSLEPKKPDTPVADILQSAAVSSSSTYFSLDVTCGAAGSHRDGAPLTLLASTGDGEITGAHTLSDGRLCLTLTAKSPYQERLTLTVTASQRTGGEVYLYRAEGGRFASQSFVGSQPDSETSLHRTFCYTKAAYKQTEEQAK